MNLGNNAGDDFAVVAENAESPQFLTRVAETPADLRAAQRLRYDVFVRELGGDGAMVDHNAQLEQDRFDPFADHLLLIDQARPAQDQIVGVYRVMTSQMARAAGGFYCQAEYDLSPLRDSGRRLLELGRSCLHADYRGGAGMFHLWAALAGYVAKHQIDVLFGVASFHGTDVAKLAQPLSLLHHRHLSPPDLRIRAIGPTATPMDMLPPEKVDRPAAVRALPPLIKAYMRAGATVGEGAFIDHDFNTVDISIILARDALNALQRNIYAKGAALG